MQIDRNTGLVLEGGGMRGVFTSGVLDAFMKHDHYFRYVVAVSILQRQAADKTGKCISEPAYGGGKSDCAWNWGKHLRGVIPLLQA